MKGRLFFKIFATYLAIAVLAIGIVGFLAGTRSGPSWSSRSRTN